MSPWIDLRAPDAVVAPLVVAFATSVPLREGRLTLVASPADSLARLSVDALDRRNRPGRRITRRTLRIFASLVRVARTERASSMTTLLAVFAIRGQDVCVALVAYSSHKLCFRSMDESRARAGLGASLEAVEEGSGLCDIPFFVVVLLQRRYGQASGCIVLCFH